MRVRKQGVVRVGNRVCEGEETEGGETGWGRGENVVLYEYEDEQRKKRVEERKKEEKGEEKRIRGWKKGKKDQEK